VTVGQNIDERIDVERGSYALNAMYVDLQDRVCDLAMIDVRCASIMIDEDTDTKKLP
jgi:hypothetical protein